MAYQGQPALDLESLYDLGFDLDLDFDIEDNKLTLYNESLVNVEQILQELVKRNEAMGASKKSRKRKASGEFADGVLSEEAKEQFKAYLLSQMQQQDQAEDAASPESVASDDDDPNAVNYDETALVYQDSHLQLANPPVLKSPIDFKTNAPIPAYDGTAEFAACLPHFSPELMEQIQAPLRGVTPTTRVIAPMRAPTLKKAGDNYLLQAYLAVTAPMLQYTSPSYVSLWTRYLPSMAQESPALMEAMLALAALQVGLRDNDTKYLTVEAPTHYHRALMAHGKALAAPDVLEQDAPLATALLMGMFELWSGENVKMGVHMLGGRDIILARGKEAHMTPVGRALYSAFRRLDVGTSAVTGNPCFFTPDWWGIDPLARAPIDEDAPTLLVSDTALAKIMIICSKLTYIKSWAVRRRRDLWLQTKGDTDGTFLDKKIKLQESINRKVGRLEKNLDDWEVELPEWFGPTKDNLYTGDDGDDEDINQTDIHVIIPRKYPHFSVALVDAWQFCLRLQMYRVRYPDMPIADPIVGGYVHAILRIFAGLGYECGVFMTPVLFFAGMELRQKPHQDWFAQELQKHQDNTGFSGIMWLLAGCRFAWMKLSGLSTGRFAKIKEGAAARIDGVSENLWSAEGVLGGMEALSLYDSPDTVRQRKNYQGDLEALTVIGEEVDDDEYIPPNQEASSSSAESSDGRYSSLEGGQPVKRARYNSFEAERNQRYLRESPGLEEALTEEVD
ncbi:hypothetical protein ABW19_dt0210649 [Dactylella cylindrospora]|nr:hypothetical protein ABW19_dt0210649 [Dactylella cylindrospora]